MRSVAGTVLVADDHAGIREIIETLLTPDGYHIVHAANGVEVLDIVSERPPDVILLDLSMPQLDGWAVMRCLREQGITIPVVILAATLHAAEHAAELGAEGSLVKPFAAADLKRVVRQVLREARARDPQPAQ